MRELSEFGRLISEKFQDAVYTRNDYEEVSIFLMLISIDNMKHEKELLKFYKTNMHASLHELGDKNLELLRKYYPNGYNSDDYE